MKLILNSQSLGKIVKNRFLEISGIIISFRKICYLREFICGTMRENSMKEKHSGGFFGHFGINKRGNILLDK